MTLAQTDGHVCSGYTSACIACYATMLVKSIVLTGGLWRIYDNYEYSPGQKLQSIVLSQI